MTELAGGAGLEVRVLTPDAVPEVVDVLREAFWQYPVMTYVLGTEGDYGTRLATLLGLFVMSRVLREEVLLAVGPVGDPDGVALVSRPGAAVRPEALTALRDSVWSELGGDARARYQAFGDATAPFAVAAPHIHLNMIGVRDRARGTGLGRRLIEHVHGMSAEDPESSGVTLTTENVSNLPLYEHFGYRIVGEATVSPELRTWGFFRPD